MDFKFAAGRFVWGGFLGAIIGFLGNAIGHSHWWWLALPVTALGFGFGVDKLVSALILAPHDDTEI